MRSGLLKSGIWLSLGIFAGRLAGLVREAVLAARLGAGEDADVAVLILTVPDLLVNILMGGALSAVLIPQLRRRKRLRDWLFIESSGAVGVTFTFVSMLLWLFASHLVDALAPGFAPEAARRATDAMRVALWVIPLTTLAGVTTAYLQARDRFAVPAFGTLIFNVTVIVGLILWIDRGSDLRILAMFVLLGALLRWLSQLLRIGRLSPGPRRYKRSMVSRTAVTRYLQVITSGGLLFVLPLVARAMATVGDSGSLAAFNYAVKLVELPLGVAVTVISIVLFPTLAGHFRRPSGDERGRHLFASGLLFVVAVSLAFTIPMIWARHEIAALVFGRGAMDESSLQVIGTLAAIGLIALPARGISSLVITTFHARLDTLSPLVLNIAGIVFFIPLGILMRQQYGLQGLMAATSVIYVVLAVAQLVVLWWRQMVISDSMEVLRTLLRLCIVAGLAFAPFALIGSALSSWSGLVRLAVAGVGSVVMLCAILPGVLEFSMGDTWRSQLLGAVSKRIFKT